MKISATIVVTVIGAITVEIGVALGLIFSGWFNVAADAPDSAVVAWIAEETREGSIEARVAQVTKASLDNSDIIDRGARLYARNCAACHLAPGMKPTGLHLGLNPEPPAFAEHKSAPEPGETYWVIDHGVRMTGMPAWGKTLSDQQIWALVAFLQKFPHLSEDQYDRMTEGVSNR